MFPTLAQTLLAGGLSAAALVHYEGFALSPAVALGCCFWLAVYLFYFSFIYPWYVSPLRHVPTVPGCALWGQFFTIIHTEIGVEQRKWHAQLGPTIRYFFPIGSERLSIANEAGMHHMMIKNPYNFPKPVRAKKWMSRILGEGVLLAEGHAHVAQRKALLPGFSIGNIRQLMPTFWSKARELADCWDRDIKASQAAGNKYYHVEVLEWLNRTTLDIIGLVGFGVDFHAVTQPACELRRAYQYVFTFDLISRIMLGLQAFIPSLKMIPFQINRNMTKSREIIFRTADEIINDKIENADPRSKDVIALLVRENEKAVARGDEPLNHQVLRDQVVTFLGAGHDTTATGMTWGLHLLTKYPHVQTKLREELRKNCPTLFERDAEMPSAVDIDKVHYFENVCREVLRLIPPIPMTVRQTIEDDQLNGYFIPAGTTVYVMANVVNMMPEFWGPTANEFDPDRWDNLPESNSPFAYQTFLQGPRSCIGRKFAETEMKAILATLLSRYEFLPDLSQEDPSSLKMWRLVLRPRDGVNVLVRPINEGSRD